MPQQVTASHIDVVRQTPDVEQDKHCGRMTFTTTIECDLLVMKNDQPAIRFNHPSSSASGGPMLNSASGEPIPRSRGLKGIRNTGADDGLHNSSNASRSTL